MKDNLTCKNEWWKSINASMDDWLKLTGLFLTTVQSSLPLKLTIACHFLTLTVCFRRRNYMSIAQKHLKDESVLTNSSSGLHNI
jgi:hypothetical protein